MNREIHQLKIVEENQMAPDLDQAIRELLCICFPPDINVFSQTRYWHGSAPAFSVVQEEKGRVLGHVGIVVRVVYCGNAPALVAGLQNVAVRPELRGSGAGSQLVIEAMNDARRRNIPWGLLFCKPEREKFYARLGWQVVHEAVIMQDEQGRDLQIIPGANLCMSSRLGFSPFPPGNIHLQGPDW